MSNDTSVLEKPDSTSFQIGEKGIFENFLETLPPEPRWLAINRARYWDAYSTLPFPHGKDEKWRFSGRWRDNLEGYHLPYQPSQSDVRAVIESSTLINSYAARMVFADNHLVHSDPLSEELLAKGAYVLTLEEALKKDPELLEKYLDAKTPDLGSEKFRALHGAFFTGATVLFVPKGLKIEKPIVVYHQAVTDKAALFPHTLVVAEDQSEVSIFDIFLPGDSNHTIFACGVANIFAGTEAKVHRSTIQNWNKNTLALQMDTLNAAKDSYVDTIAVNLGASRARFENQLHITGSGAHANMYSLSVAHGEQELDQRTLQVHSAPHATSDLLYKNALSDNSRTIFSGLIRVDKGAQQTDAYQTNRNLLLNPTAEAHSLPGLEIEANDVKCSHGATTSQIDEQELFYLKSRGIPDLKSKQLLTFGFLEEVINKFNNEEIEQSVRQLVQDSFTSKDFQ